MASNSRSNEWDDEDWSSSPPKLKGNVMDKDKPEPQAPKLFPTVPAVVNNWAGDARLPSRSRYSFISRNLIGGLEVYKEALLWNKPNQKYECVKAIVTIGIGAHEYSGVVEFVVMRGKFTDLYSDPRDSREHSWNARHDAFKVHLGTDWEHDFKASICTLGGFMTSPYFGTIRIKKLLNSKFVQTAARDPPNYSNVPDNRVILFIRVDSFLVQVHEKRHPDSLGKPRAVASSKGKIFSASYYATQLGVTPKSTPTLESALKICPNLYVIPIPERSTGRPDHVSARQATYDIIANIKKVLKSYTPEMSDEQEFESNWDFEYSAIDEFYVDVTNLVDDIDGNYVYKYYRARLVSNTFLYSERENRAAYRLIDLQRKFARLKGNEKQEYRLLCGALIGSEIKLALADETKFKASVGIASNKVMAKIASSIHKPFSTVIIAPSGFQKIAPKVKIEEVPGFGGQLGAALKENLSISTMADMEKLTRRRIAIASPASISLSDVKDLWNAARGISTEEVKSKSCPEACVVSLNLNGICCLFEELSPTMLMLCEEMSERLKLEKKCRGEYPKRVRLNIEFCPEEELPRHSATIEQVYYNLFGTHLIKNGKDLWEDFQVDKHGCRHIFFQKWDKRNAESKLFKIRIAAEFSDKIY